MALLKQLKSVFLFEYWMTSYDFEIVPIQTISTNTPGWIFKRQSSTLLVSFSSAKPIEVESSQSVS